MIYISHLLEDNEMKNLIKKTGMGIESIEFSISDNLDQLYTKINEYRKRLAFMECDHLILHGPFLDLNPMAFDTLVAEATRTRYEQAYQAAKELGAAKLILHSGFIPSVYLLTGWADRMLDFYRRFLDNKDSSIEILMENVMDPLPEPLVHIAKNISHPAFGLCLDIGHANCFSKISGATWAKMLRPYIRHLHLHDNPGDKDRHMALGMGTAPFKEILSFFDANEAPSFTLECNCSEDILSSFSQLLKSGFFN